MISLKNIIAYILKQYPHRGDLSNSRVTKLIYLADWHQAINFNTLITQICWVYDNYGPFSWEVKDTVEENEDLFQIQLTKNMFGGPKALFSVLDDACVPDLPDQVRRSLDHVIDVTNALNYEEFIRLVYSTYPVVTSERYAELDLLRKAAAYRTMTGKAPERERQA